MKTKKLSVLLATLLLISAFLLVGCKQSSQAPEAFAVSIYKVEKEQDEDGNVYITNYALWKSYSITPMQMIDLPDYDPEKEDRDCKVSYKSNYNNSRGNISGEINGTILKCKNKIQFIPYGSSIIFARERKKKTINFFYEGKNITESLSATQIEKFNKIFKDTYAESFSANDLSDFFKTLFTDTDTNQTCTMRLYTSESEEKSFGTLTCSKRYDYSYTLYYSFSGTFTLIKSTDVYLKIDF